MSKGTITLLFFLVTISLACGNKKIKYSNCPTTSVKVTIINKSNHDIIAISLQHEKDVMKNGILKDKDKALLCFESKGENSYCLTIVLDNGDTIKTKERYVEDGYMVTETVFGDTIITDYNSKY